MSDQAGAPDYSMSDSLACQLLEKIMKKTIQSETKNCILYTGRHDKYGYGVIDVKFPGMSRYNPMQVHRLRYLIHVHLLKLTPSDYHVSHLCHTKNCLNVTHLSFEPPHVNNSRQNCNGENRCTQKHAPYADCLI